MFPRLALPAALLLLAVVLALPGDARPRVSSRSGAAASPEGPAAPPTPERRARTPEPPTLATIRRLPLAPDAPPAGDGDPNRIAGPDLTIRGRVTRGGEPAAGVTVRLLRAIPWDLPPRPPGDGSPGGEPIAETATGSDGTFGLKTLRRCALVVEALGSPPRAALLRAPAEGDPDAVEIALEAGYPLHGRVLRADRAPVAGLPVKARFFASASGLFHPTLPENPLETSSAAIELETVSGPDGGYRFESLPSGFLEVRAGGLRRTLSSPVSGAVDLLLAPAGSVAGFVRDASGRALPGRLVEVATASDDWTVSVAEARADALGRYVAAGLLPGALRRARDGEGAPLRFEGGILAPGGRLERDLVAPDEESPAGAEEEGPWSRVVGRVVGWDPRAGGLDGVTLVLRDGERRQRLDAQGRFAFERVAPQRRAKILSVAFDVGPGETVELEIEPPPPRTFVGTVTDEEGRAVPGAVVHASRDVQWWANFANLQEQCFCSARTDRLGRFRIESANVPGGHAEVVAAAPGFAPSFVATSFPPRGGTREVSIRLRREAVAEGRLLDASGDGVPDALIWIRAAEHARSGTFVLRSACARTDAAGSFRVDALAPGRYRIWIQDRGPGPFEKEAPSAGWILRTERDGRIEGVVLHADGTPAHHSRVRADPWSHTMTDRSGRFVLANLPPGAHEVASEDPDARATFPAGEMEAVLRGGVSGRPAPPAPGGGR